MFDIVEKNKTAVQVVLGLVSLGLVVGVGVGGYGAIQGGQYIAKVGKTKITEREVAEVAGQEVLTAENKTSVVEQLVQEALLAEEASSLRMTASVETLRELIASLPAFQVDGKFDASRYAALLAQQRMTPEVFQEKIKRGLVLRQLTAGITQGGLSSQVLQAQMEKILGEKREVQTYVLPAQNYLNKVSVSEAEAKAYYDTHTAEFKKPDQLKLDYLVLSQADLVAAQTPSDAEVKAYFDANKQELTQEERKARHILVLATADSDKATKEKAKQQAQAILDQVQKSPSQFAEIAKAHSQDPSSANEGGELGWFARGAMTQAFEDAVFSLNKGQLSGLVESEFGWHIIQLQDIKGKSFSDVRAEVVERLKYQTAQTLFRTQSEKFKEMVYQQADSLDPTAKEFKLAVRKSAWITREGTKESILSNPKVIEAAFSDDVLRKKHNSDAIEVAPGVLVSLHVAEYEAEHIQSFAEVNAAIVGKLSNEKAVKLAQDEGAQLLTALQSGKASAVKWAPAQDVSRIDDHAMAASALKDVFRAAVDKLPAYVTSQSGQDFVIYRVNKIKEADPKSKEAQLPLKEMMAQANGQVLVASYLDALKNKITVEYAAK